MTYVYNVLNLQKQGKYQELITKQLCDLVTAIYDYAEKFKDA